MAQRPGILSKRPKADPPPIAHTSMLKRFLHHDLVGSGFLLLAALAALIMVNAGYEDQYHHFWETQFGFTLGSFSLMKSLHHWVNDGLMAIFFFLVGLEIKRELLVGELASFNRAVLPAVAALGGMICPALVYALINPSGTAAAGWGIPMATDIAFAAGCIGILRKRVPPSLMVFLVALAIVDDLGAVTVIALFYTDKIDLAPLAIGAALIVISFCMGRLGVRRTWPFALIGLIIWIQFLGSGVHATIAGVLLALTIPADAVYKSHLFDERVQELLDQFKEDEERQIKAQADRGATEDVLHVSAEQQHLIRAITTECHHVEAPLQRIEYNLEPFCVFIIMPIFAFANSGLHIEFAELGHMLREPVLIGVVLGLILGKQIGIMTFSYAAVKTGLARLPVRVTWPQVYGVSWLAAIGFTMSLFIGDLAFPAGSSPEAADYLVQTKAGIFIASLLAGIIGLAILRAACPLRTDADT